MSMRRRYPITTSSSRSGAVNRAQRPQSSPRIGGRVSLVALQEEIELPAHQGLVAIHKLKVLRIEQMGVPIDALPAPRWPISAQHSGKQIGAATRRGLPPRQAEAQELECRLDGRSVRLRSVRGLMTDDSGNFYEVNGRQLRPLGELVRDEHGRVFEVHPTSERPAAESANERPTVSAAHHREAGSKTENDNRAEAPAQPTAQAVPKEPSRGYSKIIADPGLYLKIPWARAKGELTTLIQQPERLSDADEIECYAQIYEAQRTVPAAEIAAAELGDRALHSQLHPLTRDKAQMLGTPQLFRPTRDPFETRASSRQVHAGQRVFRVWPVFDPTADRESKPNKQPAAGDERPILRSEIPRQCLNAQHFKYSREEVLYDMKSALGTLPPEAGALVRWFFIYPLRMLKAAITSVMSRRRMKKWRTMLEGKNHDEQLWAVTPPRSFPYHPSVRRWAEESLSQAGYDPRRMFLEWEIFWRRKGWK